MSNIYIRTYAYNAEKTLIRTIESVLNQTYEDFEYYLCDNGSKDSTREIIQEYAKRDKRIKPFYNDINHNHTKTMNCLNLAHNIGDEDFYCTLDSDDEYYKTFFEDSLYYIKEYDLDICACGSDFVLANNPEHVISQRLFKKDCILEGKLFESLFPYYHQFMRTTWGKLYKGKVMRNTIQDTSKVDVFPTVYGGDTYNTLRTFKEAKRVGIIAKPLHRYYVSTKSVSFQFNTERIETDKILHEATKEYLNTFGPISPLNNEYMYVVYMNALGDTLNVILNSKEAINVKLNSIFEICDCNYTKNLAVLKNFGQYLNNKEVSKARVKLFSRILKYLCSVDEVENSLVMKYCDTGEIISAFLEDIYNWVFFNKLRISFLIKEERLEEAKIKLEELLQLMPEDINLIKFKKNIQLKNKK